MTRITQKLFTGLLLGAFLIAMVANGALAAGRAASHAGGVAHTAPPCHHVDTNELAAPEANPCDTLCAGSAPELTLDHPPNPALFIALSITPAIERCLNGEGAALPRPAHHHPPPLPPYQRGRRLLI